jgi:signal transduction histidine kinase
VSSPTLTVRLHQSGTRPEMPASQELAVYRIVQEALTNTVKHAAATRADISIGYHPHGVEVRVVDDGRGPNAREEDAGHGLGGIRERVAMFGGTLASGPGAAGGFQVHAHLPVATTPAVAPP